MTSTDVHRRWGWLAVAAAGSLAATVTLGLPWRAPEFPLGLGGRVVMAVGGVLVLLVAALWLPRRARAVAWLTGLLGATTLAYPVVLSLWSAGAGGPGWRGVLEPLAMTGHVWPLTLVKVLPVVACGSVLGAAGRRRAHRWLAALLVITGVGVGLDVAAAAGLAGSGAAAAGLVLWLVSFLVPPVATWTAGRGAVGEERRRAAVTGLAALVPVVVIVACGVLGGATEALGLPESVAADLLCTGLAAGVVANAALSAAAVQAAEPLVRTRVVVSVLDGVLALICLVAFAWLSTSVADHLSSAAAVLVGGVAALAVALPWLRWHGWVARVVDPTAELRHELAADTAGRSAAAGDGEHRPSLERVLRRVVGDPHLAVRYPTPEASHTAADADDGSGVVLAHSAGAPAVVVLSSSPAARARLARLGDCSDLLRPAVLEAQLAQADQLARLAAGVERRRLSQDLHDGLQGRLLGLALHLQLSARDVDEPTSRLLLDQAVDVLRRAVDDVRAVADHRLPQLLVEQGLGPALTSLFGQLRTPSGERPAVLLDVPATRFGSPAEATAYFVVSEAVANALKHAQASTVQVRVSEPCDGRVVVTVDDDGAGGADPRTGSGLRGLAERVRSADGLLVVRDGGGPGRARGTVVEAVLPCGS